MRLRSRGTAAVAVLAAAAVLGIGTAAVVSADGTAGGGGDSAAFAAPSGPASQPPAGLASRLTDTVSPAAGGQVRWTTRWELTWRPVPGAMAYAVSAVGPEGEASSLLETVTQPRLTLSVAAGTTDAASRIAARDGQVAYRATQLGVRVAAVFPDGSTGPPSPVTPVGAILPSPSPSGPSPSGP